MKEIALFAGVGCGLLGTQYLGIETILYVEKDPYKRGILHMRMEESFIHKAPIFPDITCMASRQYNGYVDFVSGGFPCQAFSKAARGRNKPERNLWPEMARVIREVEPKYVFAENVDKAAIETAATDCASMGYKTEMLPLSASDLGADHIRQRYWLLAYADDKSQLRSTLNAKVGGMQELCEGFWSAPPIKSGVSNGVATRMDRFTAAGDGQVPVVAAAALISLAMAA